MLSRIFGLIVSVGLIICGLSGFWVLRGTNSSNALIGAGIVLMVWDVISIVRYVRRKRKKNRSTTPVGMITNHGMEVGFMVAMTATIAFWFYRYYAIYAFAKATNIICRGDGKKTHGVLVYMLLSLVTLGVYAIVWHCEWINRCNQYLVKNGKPEKLQVSTYLLSVLFPGCATLFVMPFVVFFKKCYLQNAVNKTYNELHNLDDDEE